MTLLLGSLGLARGLGRRYAVPCALLVSLCVLAACGDDDDDSSDAGDAAADASDAPMDGPLNPGEPCTTDADCDDAIDCTRDACGENGFCRNTADHAVCDDDVFCNGVEVCSASDGCVAGPPNTCDDGDVCTFDRCNEDDKTCAQIPRDFDGDGEVDWHCGEGTDCDDRDPVRGSTLPEICQDTVDNDCDSDIDETMCGRGAHDLCDDPLDVSAGGRFLVSLAGATSDYVLSCAPGYREVVLRLTLTEAHDVRVTADSSEFLTAVSLRSDCMNDGSEVECSDGFPAEVRARALPAGTYFVLVAGGGAGDADIEVELTPPSDPPVNERCASATVIPTDGTGGHIEGTFVDVEDDLGLDCGYTASPDLFYAFTLTEPRDVRVSLGSEGGDTLAFDVRSGCDDGAPPVSDAGVPDAGDDAAVPSPARSLRCASGSPAGALVHSLEPGTYVIAIEGSSFREVDFTLDVQFLPGTPEPAGDSCGSARPLTIGMPTVSTLADKEDNHVTSCGFSYRDEVWSFEITERRDVTITVDGGTVYMNMSVRSDCTDDFADLRCVSGSPSRAKLRDLGPGTYYVIAESYEGSGYTITVETAAPTTATVVSGNDTCSTPYAVPSTGGLFTGAFSETGICNTYQSSSCGGMAAGRDAIFQVDLDHTQRVVASTEGSALDTVLYVYRSMCPALPAAYTCPPTTTCTTAAECSAGSTCVGGFCLSPAPPASELYCDDDGGDGSTSLLDRELEAGTYFFVVDGFSSSATGPYTFEVAVSEP